MTIAIAAAALAVFSVFQRAFNAAFAGSESSLEIENNTLLQKGTGWVIVACAIGILGGACLHRLDRRRATVWALLVLVGGAVILGATVYQVTGYRDVVESAPNPLLILMVARGSPAVGIHAAQAAGVLAVSAGFVLTFLSRGSVGEQAPPTRVGARPLYPTSGETPMIRELLNPEGVKGARHLLVRVSSAPAEWSSRQNGGCLGVVRWRRPRSS